MKHRHWKIAIPLVLALVTLAVFWQVRSHEFINIDDETYVTENPFVRGGLTADNLAWAFAATHASNWHPLTWISHQMDVQFFGMNPTGHHLVNLFFHVANTLLLFFVLHRMTQTLWQSAFVAALFALHPLHVESVAWVAERKDVLSTFFLFLTLWAYFIYTRSPGLVRFIPVVVLFALGLMSKPMLVTLPFVLLLLDYWPLGRYAASEKTSPPAPPSAEPAGKKKKQKKKRSEVESPVLQEQIIKNVPITIFRDLLIEKIPLFALTVISSIITFFAQHRGGAMTLLDIPLLKRLGNALVSYISYIVKSVYPQGLSVIYPYPAELAVWQVLGSAAMLAAVTVLIIHYRKPHPYAFVGWLWYLGTLVPVIGVVQVGRQAMADRYSYVPLIGLFIVVVWGTGELASRLRVGRKILVVLAGVVMASLTAVTWNHISCWRDSITLFEQALRVTEQNSMAHINLGVALSQAGKEGVAAEHYREAIRIDPNSSVSHYNLAVFYSSTGGNDAAQYHYREAIRIDPDYASAYINLARLLVSQRRVDEAIPYYLNAIALEPAAPEVRCLYGITLVLANRLPEATEQFRIALEIRRDDPEVHNFLGTALLIQGYKEEAILHFRQALQLKPDFSKARRNLEGAIGSQNDPNAAAPPQEKARSYLNGLLPK